MKNPYRNAAIVAFGLAASHALATVPTAVAVSGPLEQYSHLTAVEYYNPRLDRYFVTTDPGEQAVADDEASLLESGWQRSGRSFGVWHVDAAVPGTAVVCRFAADPIIPPRSFYDTMSETECASLLQLERDSPPGRRAWRYVGEPFRAVPAFSGVCATGLVPVYALYNLGFERGVDLNFRYVSSHDDFNAMIDQGWVGVARPHFCARPD